MVGWYHDFVQRMMGELAEHLSRDMTELLMAGVPIKELVSRMEPQFLQLLDAMAMAPGFQMGISPQATYRILGLERSATDEELRKRYRELLRQLHPDTAGVRGTEFLLQIVMAAYEVIKRERGWR